MHAEPPDRVVIVGSGVAGLTAALCLAPARLAHNGRKGRRRCLQPLGARGYRRATSGEVMKLRGCMEDHVGVLRNASDLARACEYFATVRTKVGGRERLGQMAEVGLLVALAALNRTESRGAHARTDFPDCDAEWARHQDMTLRDADARAGPFSARPSEEKVA